LALQSDFLLFMPAHDSGSSLEAALSYYSSMVTLNAEGDSSVSEETLEGLGTTGFLLQALFGSLLKIAYPDQRTTTSTTRPVSVSTGAATAAATVTDATAMSTLSTPTSQLLDTLSEPPEPASVIHIAELTEDGSSVAAVLTVDTFHDDNLEAIETDGEKPERSSAQAIMRAHKEATKGVKTTLTDLLPDPGYFLAGALSGGVSRTATAPLDRLKVFLLVNTRATSSVAIDAAKHGHPLQALRNAARPIGDAVMTLWKAGGIRTFFAGELWRVPGFEGRGMS
jgi:solute carrier family 25 phosphate transporter 23/24/25/41